MDKIKKVSTVLKYLFTVLLIAIPIIEIWAWFSFSGMPDEFLTPSALGMYPDDPVYSNIDPLDRMLGIISSSPLILAEMYGIWQVVKLFRLYSIGSIFDSANIICYKRAAWAFIISQLITPISQAGATISATLNNGVGNRMVIISFDETNLGAFLVGITVLVVSWVMQEGHKLKTDAELTI